MKSLGIEPAISISKRDKQSTWHELSGKFSVKTWAQEARDARLPSGRRE